MRNWKLACIAALAAAGSLAAQTAASKRVPGRLLIGKTGPQADAAVGAILARHGGKVDRQLPALGIDVISIADAKSAVLKSELVGSGAVRFAEEDHIASTAVTPNDPYFGQQWHLARIRAAGAWDRTSGASVTVAVIDSGVDGAHPDLAGQLLAGWSFQNNSSDTSDVQGHGTAVAGTIAAAWNNGTGGSGVAPGARILPVAVSDSSGQAPYSYVASAIQYAADHGARIISISLGGPVASATLQSAVDYAWNRGAVVFAAAGNDASSTPSYPAACTNAVAVGATDSNDLLAAFSNYGSWVTLTAPGVNVLSTVRGGGYAYWSGTSFSTPVASGVGALALSANPGLSASGLVALLKTNSADLGSSGFDPSFGWGRVDAQQAVSGTSTVRISISPASAQLQAGGTLQFSATVSGTLNTAVAWSASAGTISPSGLYTAPGSAGAALNVAVTATSLADPSQTATSTVTVNPPVAAPLPAWVNASPASISGGGSTTISFGLAGPAPASGVNVAIGMTGPLVLNAPTTVFVPGGATGGSFTATAQQVSSTVTTYVIVNSAGGAVLAAITVAPVAAAPPPPGPGLLWASLSTPSIRGGDTAAVVFQLSSAAPDSGATVSISSSDPSAAAPQPSVTVAPGMVIGVGYIPTSPVASPRSVTFTLRSGTSTQTVALTVY